MKNILLTVVLVLFMSGNVYAWNAGKFQTNDVEMFRITLTTTTVVSSTDSYSGNSNYIIARSTTSGYDIQISTAYDSLVANRFTIVGGGEPVVLPFTGAVYAIADSTANPSLQLIIGK